jgi:SAM-dependent methyltransferase
MIRVLQSWDQVGEALLALQRQGLPTHESAQKNWDHWTLTECVKDLPKDAKILDLGCGSGFTLKLLAASGFKDLDGIDSQLTWRLWVARALWAWRNKTLRAPYRLHRGDFTQMKYASNTYDLAFSVSVIEHGVRLAPFLEECHRVLKPNGTLLLTADFWHPKVPTDSTNHAFGRAWHIFSKDEIERLLFVANKVGFHLVEPGPIPIGARPMIHWQRKDYTAISMLLRKNNS